jgi:hypothetical protein
MSPIFPGAARVRLASDQTRYELTLNTARRVDAVEGYRRTLSQPTGRPSLGTVHGSGEGTWTLEATQSALTKNF